LNIGTLYLVAVLCTCAWVLVDAPRHGLSRMWAIGCFFLWVAFFPSYLIARHAADETTGRTYRKRPGWRARMREKHVQAAALAVLVTLPITLLGLWELRLLFRGPYMLFLVRHPALVTLPLLCGGVAFGLHALVKLVRRAARGQDSEEPPEPARRSRKRGASVQAPADRPATTKRARYTLGEWRAGGWRGRGRPAPFLFGPATSFAVLGALGFVAAAFISGSWTGRAIYEHADYGELSLAMLEGGEPRLKPYEVAHRQSQNGLNSPTERPTNLHIVKVGGELLWTSVRDPDGLFRVLTKPTRGVMSVAAASTAPRVLQTGRRYDADFRYGPGMRISENLKWQVYKKKCFSCDVAEMTGIPTAQGPVVIAPYIRYVGNWLVRRPTLGGVYVLDPDGRIDDLSPEEAARSTLVRESGRLFPENLTRRIADAYKYKRGIWNRLFVHEEQLEVADTEENRQPFLQDFARLGPQWVTTLKPRGRTFTTAAVMTTDAVSGRTRIWVAPGGRSLIGNQRALDIVRGESFPGIDFAERSGEDAGGKFRVVEPRQIFPGGRLHFLLSIIPNAANRVTMSVIVDAESQGVVGKFPANPEGDEDLLAFLRTGEVPTGEREPAAPEEDEPRTPEEDGPARTGTDTEATLRRLLRENRAEQRRAAGRIEDLEAQERDLRRLLRETGK
jgi:hypothetical protein